MIIHVDGAASISDVFNAKSDIQEILDNKNVTIKGYKLEAKVEQSAERKKWLSIYFNNVRAIEKTTGTSMMKNGADWHLETRTFSIFHLDYPEEAVGKLNKQTLTFEYDSKVLDKINVKEADIRDQLS